MGFCGELGDNFAPMNYKKEDDNDYYSAYCTVKHNRGNMLYKANINILIRAMAALYILNLYYLDNSVNTDDLIDFDPSQGSDIFVSDYGDANNSDSLKSYIYLVYEDAEYSNKIKKWVDKMPINLNNMLEFEKSNPQPSQYKITLNKICKESTPHV